MRIKFNSYITFNLIFNEQTIFSVSLYNKHFALVLSWFAVTGPTTHSPALADHAPEEIEGEEDGDEDEEED